MFYISLPYFYQNNKFNDFFIHYISNSNNKHKLVEKFTIDYYYGAFPWSHWNGHKNVHSGSAVLVPEMQNIIAKSITPLRLDESNIFIKEKDFENIHENATLKTIFETGSVCEISNLKLMDFILSKNPNMRFIISNNMQISDIFTEEKINEFINKSEIELISIANIENFDLTKIKNKSKLEIIIDDCKNCSCTQRLQCNIIEQTNIYNFSGKSVYPYCSKNIVINNFYEEIKPFLKQGIFHFKLDTNNLNLKDFNIKIITSFIKPEYIGECLIEYYKII